MFDLSRFSLKGKTAIVTGGSRGIGKGVALGLAKAGARVAVTSRKMNDLEATAAEIKGFGGEAFPLQSHLGKMEEINRMVSTVMDKFGRIDILVNNAGASPAMGSVLDSDERLWETIMNLNLRRALLHQPGGRQDHEEAERRQNHQYCFRRWLQAGTRSKRV